ncbi:MAG: hypothetical protein AB1499_08170 [Nitrospirota bacterium]
MNLRQRWQQTTLANQLMVITTAIVAFGTVFYVIVAIFQWQLMKEAGEQTSDQMNKVIAEARRIADISSDSAKQAKDALDATIDNFRLEQRAWVGVEGVLPPEYKDGNKKIYVKSGQPMKTGVTIKNTGKTPALKIQSIVSMFYWMSNHKFVPTFDKQVKGAERPSTTVLQPGGTYILIAPPIPEEGVINEADIANITNSRQILYIAGKITYEDVFNRQHSTFFCMYLTPTLTNFSHCNGHNEAN